MLRLLKIVHTLIWTIMAAANFTAFYLALVGRYNVWFYLSIVLLAGEIVIVIFNSWHCPLTDIMAKYTSDRRANFDIYLPEWLARNNIKVFSVLMALEVIVLAAQRAGL
jgi:hypothetical protein